MTLLDAESGNFVVGQWLEFDVTTGIRTDGRINFVVSISSSTDGTGFSSTEGADSPQLYVTVAEPGLIGDANSDGMVDAIDYVIWRHTLGSQSDLRADFDHSRSVDSNDYDLWRANFGKKAERAISVASYGAVPNDSVFDDAEIQAAINANTSVYLPPGEYWLSKKLVVLSGRTLSGPSSGPPAVLRVRFDTGVNANNYAIEITGNGVAIQGLVIDKDFIDGSYGVGILAWGRSNLTISGVEIRDYSVRYGIHLIECDNFRITNCYVHDFMMNQSRTNGHEADMIQDSPAGIRITRSTRGVISNSRIHNIEVGPNGRASVSELVPSYGLQGYQADCITLSDSSGITVENNDLWNSGELVDILVSDHCIVRNNMMQMAFLFVVKCIGSQNSIVTGNYLADGAIGIILVDHTIGEQCTGNLVDGNNIVDCGSPGIWNIPASNRLGLTISAIYVDNNASGNTISNNDIYDDRRYLMEGVRQGTGSNTLMNNDRVTTTNSMLVAAVPTASRDVAEGKLSRIKPGRAHHLLPVIESSLD